MSDILTVTGGEFQTNCYIIEENNEVILIDFVSEAEDIIKKKGYKIEKVLLTHTHFDHIIGLGDFQNKYDFELVLSENARKNINDPDKNLLSLIPAFLRKNFKNIDLNNCKVLKNLECFLWNDNQIQLFESPGHTDDSVIYIFKDKRCAFTGDTVFNTGIGRTDFPNGDYNLIIESIRNFFSFIDDDYILYPGHGRETKVLFEKKNNPFILDFFK
ncbi:MAG: MBL fold metallo-hydrolase [Spirochaetes bacterium]|nr:MBL fold metallo-hydrolase [Spirochaetota bacterium]